ncbi:MAG TPA: putative baseplate assembly protein [Burkholderiales bacterium]|nr:putative baseplate assembly protein [Burkholderiales bacterium]
MPLENLIPNLDDRRYDDIVAEIRTRIARYAPEWQPGASAWTDVNDNDPGVTLAQVFAWLAEMLIFRMNRVPALSYLKFLQLIGIELRPAEPALAEVRFGVQKNFAERVVRLPEHTQVSADPGDGSPTLVFETKTGLVALRAQLDAVVVADPDTGTVPATQANADATQGFQAFGARAADDSWLGLGFIDPSSTPADLPAETLDIAVVVKPRPQSSAINARPQYLSCGVPDTRAFGPAKLVWEYLSAGAWVPLALLKDETLAFTRSGHVYLKLPLAGIPLAARAKLDPSDPGEPLRYWIRARVTQSQYERPPELLAIRTNTVAVEQAETVQGELLGGSDGSRSQTFQLANRPLLKDTLLLEIQQSDERPERWTEVQDFFGSEPSDKHYTLDRGSGEIRTGNGVNGDIPVAFVGNPGANVVAVSYRFGGGKRGNVAAGAINTLVAAIDGIDPNEVANLLAAHSGRDEETLDEAIKRAPSSLRSRCRAVTADDYEFLAQQAANVRRAKALPLFHPDFPQVKVPGTVSVIVVPDADDKEPQPMPSDGTLRTVCAYLDARRVLTAELFVLKPRYQQVLIRVQIIAADNADLAKLHDDIEKALVDYFHALRGGEDGLGWPFGGPIYYSRVYQRVFGIKGRVVDRIASLIIVLDGEEQRECTDVPIAVNALLYSGEHEISVNYSFEQAT